MRDIINTFDHMMHARQVGLPSVFIELDSHLGSRYLYITGWRVRQIASTNQRGNEAKIGLHVNENEVNLDPQQNRHWSESHVGKCFREDDYPERDWRKRRKTCLNAAMAWASERVGVAEWNRTSFGNYIDGRVNKQFPIRKETIQAASK